MKITNKHNLPYGLVRAVSPKKHNAPGCISATTLIQGVKQIILTERHWDELTDDVSNRIWAVFGTAVHSLMETEGENEFTEIEMKHKVGGVTVTGKIDNYNLKDGTICDYKTTSVYKVKAAEFDDWYTQGMTYAWLLKKNGLPATRCRFIAMLKDHSMSEAERNPSYPQEPMFIHEFDVTEERLAAIEEAIMKKLFAYQLYCDSPDDAIPECTPSERWAKEDTYAVMKNGRKTAVRLFNDKEQAERFCGEQGKGHYVELRQGESTRCKRYCLCNGFCSYYKQTQNTNTENAELKEAA